MPKKFIVKATALKQQKSKCVAYANSKHRIYLLRLCLTLTSK